MASDFVDSTFAREFTVDSSLEQVSQIAEQSDGRFVVTSPKGISRIERDGTQDMTFASDGTYDLESAGKLMVDSHDRIVFLRRQTSAPYRKEIVRLLDNGQFDLSFGGDGIGDQPVSGEWSQLVAVLPDGAVIATSLEDGVSHTSVLHKVSTSGELDETFRVPEIDSKGVGWGAATSTGELIVAYRPLSDRSELMLAKLTPDGQFIRSFGNAGTVMAFEDIASARRELALDSSDRIVVAEQSYSTDYQAVIHRLLPDGSPDVSFGIGGEHKTDFSLMQQFESEYDGPPLRPIGCPGYWQMFGLGIDAQDKVFVTASLSRDDCGGHIGHYHFSFLSVNEDGTEELRGYIDDGGRRHHLSGDHFLISGTARSGLGPDRNDLDRTNEISVLQLGENYSENYSRWHNPTRPLDVNGDGHISPMDALNIINALEQAGVMELVNAEVEESLKVDTNNDHYLSPIDLLLVINRLDQTSIGESGPEVFPPKVSYFCPMFDHWVVQVQIQLTPDMFDRFQSGNEPEFARLIQVAQIVVESAQDHTLILRSYASFDEATLSFNRDPIKALSEISGIVSIQPFILKDVRSLDVPTTCV